MMNTFALVNNFPIFLLIMTNFHNVYGQRTGSAGTGGQIIDFATLDLKADLLRGSRWSIEQRKKSKLINVYHAIEIVDISKVDVNTMSVRIEIHMRQRWTAEELKLPDGLFKNSDPPETFIQADPKVLDSMWSPDSYIPVARETQIADFTTQQSVVNIFRNKTIIYKARLYTILGCNFDFRWYPLDKQICSLTIESYTTADDLVRYMWETNQLPIVYANLKLLQYDLRLPPFYTNGTAERWGRSSTFPYVSLDFAFERQLGHHMIQVFIPTSLVVILSWFSFWLGLDAIPGRISLLITCMLTLVTMHSGLKGAIPPVNYIKMMDVWMVACMAFVFLALGEFVVVKYLHWKKQLATQATQEKEKAMKEYMDKMKEMGGGGGKEGRDGFNFNPYLAFHQNMSINHRVKLGAGMNDPGLGFGPGYPRPAWEMGGFQNFGPYPPNPNNSSPQPRPVWVTIDRVSRALFPLSFAVFCAVYWPWLIIGAANQ